ncbi:hypothetical protein KI387_030226, partial [Taxus chinensis]
EDEVGEKMVTSSLDGMGDLDICLRECGGKEVNSVGGRVDLSLSRRSSSFE